MQNNLIKSKDRVQKHGEVFTPTWMVQKMLDIPGVKEACEDVSATFLEPSTGDGNFLQAILERKLDAVVEQFDESKWKIKSLTALSSIYGIEILDDNLEIARTRMFVYYLNWYEKTFNSELKRENDMFKSAYYLINKNIVSGNTLTQQHPLTGDSIRFNEWKPIVGHPDRVRVIPFTFNELLEEKIEYDKTVVEGQMNLFEIYEEFILDEVEGQNLIEYSEISIKKVYLLGD